MWLRLIVSMIQDGSGDSTGAVRAFPVKCGRRPRVGRWLWVDHLLAASVGETLLKAGRAEIRQQIRQIGEIDVVISVEITISVRHAARQTEVSEQRRQIGQVHGAVSVHVAGARGWARPVTEVGDPCFFLSLWV